MIHDIMLRVIKLSDVMLSVMAPKAGGVGSLICDPFFDVLTKWHFQLKREKRQN